MTQVDMMKTCPLERERRRIIRYSRTALDELQHSIEHGASYTIAEKGRMKTLMGEFRVRLAMLKRGQKK
jgi:hypothetical protein